ncbi:MAG: rRNA maturation RNase YbeY [Gammaproteobacteria bacterium]|nr:MAG: rRNA maturation RNase YbeY [Gammaproteobacteria bacterium]
MNTNPGIDIQCAITADGLPSSAQLLQWVQHALRDRAADAELTLRIVDEAEITALNSRYRGKDGPTNVLAFPYQPLPGVESGLLGDIVICVPVVAREAVAQGKSLEEHWAHIIIHGVLHLLGHEHKEAEEAGRMEQLETQLLGQLGYSDPYQARIG